MDKTETKKISNKTHIKNKKRFYITISVMAVILIIVIILIVATSNIKNPIDDNTNISRLNANKYSSELLEIYNKPEAKEEFLDDYDKIQTSIAMYILNNSTKDENSFSNILSIIKKELKKSNCGSLQVEKTSNWNGEFTIDDNGSLKFKFGIKSIEPNWINDSEVINKIIKN